MSEELKALQKGSKVEVFSQDDWWEAEVVLVEEGGKEAKVHYVGGAEEEDEWIPIISSWIRFSSDQAGAPVSKKRGRETAAEPVPVPSSFSFKKGGWRGSKEGGRRQWKNLKKILDGEGYERLPLDAPTYTSLEAPPPLLPVKKYCDFTGLEAKYTEPKTQIRYHSTREYSLLHYTQDHTVQELLKWRNATVNLK